MPKEYANLKRKGLGRKQGQVNKFTRSAKEAWSLAFEGLGGVDGLIQWGIANRTEFYKLHARLIPAELPAAPSVVVNVGTGPITNMQDAASVYEAFLRDATLDISNVTFAAPEPPALAPSYSSVTPLADPMPVEAPAEELLDPGEQIAQQVAADDAATKLMWERLCK